MGKWFSNHLTSQGFEVAGYDERRGDDSGILSKSDIVVISVTIDTTADVIRHVTKFMRKDATLIEIASLKSGIHEAMTEASKLGLKTLSIHPMFGPTANGLDGKTVVVIPVSDVEAEVKQTTLLFPSSSIIISDLETHDRLMSLILSLPYLINLALAEMLKEENLQLLRSISGTSFALQYILIQSISAEKTSLINGLLSENKFLSETVQKFTDNIEKILRASESKTKFIDLHNDIQVSMMRDEIHSNSQMIRQSAYNLLKNSNKKYLRK